MEKDCWTWELSVDIVNGGNYNIGQYLIKERYWIIQTKTRREWVNVLWYGLTQVAQIKGSLNSVVVVAMCDLQIPTTPQMAARENRITQLTERINKLVEEVCCFCWLLWRLLVSAICVLVIFMWIKYAVQTSSHWTCFIVCNNLWCNVEFLYVIFQHSEVIYIWLHCRLMCLNFILLRGMLALQECCRVKCLKFDQLSFTYQKELVTLVKPKQQWYSLVC